MIGEDRPPFSNAEKGGDLKGDVGDSIGDMLGVGTFDPARDDFLLC